MPLRRIWCLLWWISRNRLGLGADTGTGSLSDASLLYMAIDPSLHFYLPKREGKRTGGKLNHVYDMLLHPRLELRVLMCDGGGFRICFGVFERTAATGLRSGSEGRW